MGPRTFEAAKILDGKAASAALRTQIARRVADLKAKKSLTPGLAVVLVGEDAASQIYVKKKGEACREAGMQSFEHRLPATTSTEQLLKLLAALNADRNVHGILVQLPLPKGIEAEKVLDAVSPLKDVDGFHPENVGLLQIGRPRFTPCTPLGVMRLLDHYKISLEGKHAVVLGRSNIVGKPLAALLLGKNASVSICHSKTNNLERFLKDADLVVAAIGKPQMVSGKSLKDGVIVIDVGINRLGNGKLVGDVDFDSALAKASFITPVPGGVGPMTIACLLENTLLSAEKGMKG